MTPLVSIIVVTYNSAKFVLETLESVKSQSYQNLELIITDDSSKDNTMDICREWIGQNKSFFKRTKILTSPINTGIPSNFNRGIRNATGSWLKPIAGDDALLPNCIQENVDYVLKHPEVKALYSFNKVYKNDFKSENYLGLNPTGLPTNIITDEITAHEQYTLLLTGDRIPFTPSLFLNREALFDAGLPDEDLFSEHYQTILKLTMHGYKLNFMEKETVLYRKHDDANNNTNKQYIFKPHYFKTEDFRRRYIYPFIPLDLRMSQKFAWVVNQLFKLESVNKKNKRNLFIFYVLNAVINPFKYCIYIKSKFIRKYKNDLHYQ